MRESRRVIHTFPHTSLQLQHISITWVCNELPPLHCSEVNRREGDQEGGGGGWGATSWKEGENESNEREEVEGKKKRMHYISIYVYYPFVLRKAGILVRLMHPANSYPTDCEMPDCKMEVFCHCEYIIRCIPSPTRLNLYSILANAK